MSDPYLGEIKIFAGTFTPIHYAFCSGALIPVSQNEALFALLADMYGGDGRTSFGLPEMRGRVPLHTGAIPGLTTRRQGARFGVELVTLRVEELPIHSHPFMASSLVADSPLITGGLLGADNPNNAPFHFSNNNDPSILIKLNDAAMDTTGGGQPHENRAPIFGINYIIALQGIFPSRN